MKNVTAIVMMLVGVLGLAGGTGAAACERVTSEAAVLTVTPECPCDWNASGDLTSQDFFNFLTAFFNSDADLNGDGETTSQDFFDFLACFFSPPAGCIPPLPPNAPTNVSATDGAFSQHVEITWTAPIVGGPGGGGPVTSYSLFRSTSQGGCDTLLAGPIADTFYSDMTATPGVTYYYSVQAFGPGGGSGCSNVDAGYAGPTIFVPLQNFENGLSGGWTIHNFSNGLWHIASTGECGSVTQMVAYNNPGGTHPCTYWTGITSNNIGDLYSPSFVLRTPTLELSFDYLLDLDATGDSVLAQLMIDDVPVVLFFLSSSNLPEVHPPSAPAHVSRTAEVQPSWYGQTVYLRFRLTTGIFQNLASGWQIDNIELRSNP